MALWEVTYGTYIRLALRTGQEALALEVARRAVVLARKDDPNNLSVMQTVIGAAIVLYQAGEIEAAEEAVALVYSIEREPLLEIPVFQFQFTLLESYRSSNPKQVEEVLASLQQVMLRDGFVEQPLEWQAYYHLQMLQLSANLNDPCWQSAGHRARRAVRKMIDEYTLHNSILPVYLNAIPEMPWQETKPVAGFGLCATRAQL